MAFRAFAGLGAAIAIWTTCTSTLADAAPSPEARAANDLLDLFSRACMKNLGRPDGVRAWAESQELRSVDNPEALQVYAGGDDGAAWAASTPAGHFVLAIRAPDKACAVFADMADPHVVEGYIGQLMQALKQTGRAVTMLKNDQRPTSAGNRHGVVYAVGGGSRPSLETFTVITDEQPGGAYQATVQVLAVGGQSRAQEPAPRRP